jgi:caffeoyl-CoA O-methyltransferase
MHRLWPTFLGIVIFTAAVGAGAELPGQSASSDLDSQVRAFLQKHAHSWQDLNIPAADGQSMYDIIIQHKYRRALEIGTSTGHSGVWIAWALSKTGGKLITIEIDQGRHKEALENFREAGLSKYIDARLGDAHQLVPALEGSFDFVFCDADKDWYNNYFKAVLPKMSADGCFAAHNISERGWGGGYSREFLQLVRNVPNMETTVLTNGGGLSVSYKKAAN